jgi:adenylate kinase
VASLYHARLGIAHLSTGGLFRQEMARRSPLGRRVQRYVASGRLVPDALVIQVMATHLDRRTLRRGCVLDGFPRTAGQAAGLDRLLRQRGALLDGAVYLAAPQALLIRRLSGRRVCGRCGANYHIRTMRPQRAGRCDRCHGPLTIRKDDQPATIRNRLAIDRRVAEPLLRYYRRRGCLHPLNASGSPEAVFARSLRLFHRQGWWDDRAEERQRG